VLTQDAGFDDHLVKPVEAGKLKALIDAQLARGLPARGA
jgi:hypothetical protein